MEFINVKTFDIDNSSEYKVTYDNDRKVTDSSVFGTNREMPPVQIRQWERIFVATEGFFTMNLANVSEKEMKCITIKCDFF